MSIIGAMVSGDEHAASVPSGWTPPPVASPCTNGEAADYDHEASKDLFITCWGRNRLLRNHRYETITNVTEKAGISHVITPWYGLTSAAADFDGNGWPDI